MLPRTMIEYVVVHELVHLIEPNYTNAFWARKRERARLRPILDSQIAALVKHVGASPRSVQVRDLGYRWGSCGHNNGLSFGAF